MINFARMITAIVAAYMSVTLIFTGARNPFMGIDYTLYGDAPRPSSLVGHTWSLEKMRQWSKQFDVDVVVSGSPSKPGEIAGYTAGPDSEFADWLRDGYPCLKRPCVARPVSLATNPQEIEAFEVGVSDLSFMGKNSQAAAEAAGQYYHKLGWKTGIQDMNSKSFWLSTFKILFGDAALILSALVAILTAGTNLSRSKSIGVKLLLGNSRKQILTSDIVIWTGKVLVTAATALLLIYVTLRITREGNFFSYVLVAYTLITAALWLTGVLGLALAHQILRSLSLLETIKGRIRFGATFPLLYILRTVVLIFCGLLVLNVNQGRLLLNSNKELRSHLGAFSGYSSYGVNTGVSDNNEVRKRTAQELTPLYRNGQVVVARARPQFFYRVSRDMDIKLHPGNDQMVSEVSFSYLNLRPVTLSDGSTLKASGLAPDKVTLLFPEGTPPAVREEVREYITRSMFDGGGIGRVLAWDLRRVPSIEMTTAPGQHHVASIGGTLSEVVNPILIILPSRLVLGNEFAYTSEGIYFKTSDLSEIAAKVPALMKGITGFEAVSKALEQTIDLQRTNFTRDVFKLCAYLILLPLFSIAAVLMYARQHARRTFVQVIAGRPWVEMVPLLILLDLCSLAVTAYFARPKAATMDLLHSFGTDAYSTPARNFAVVILLAVLLFLVEYIVLTRTRHTVLRQRAAES